MSVHNCQLTRALVTCLLLGASSAVTAQQPGLNTLRRRIKSEELSLLVLLQTTGEYDPSDRSGSHSGFRVPNARIALGGELARKRFSYLVQASFTATPSLLDLRLGYHPAPQLALEVGQFKASFSQEALTGAGDLEFTERAPVVTALAPARQLGGQVRGMTSNGLAELAIGAFNGNGQGRSSNDDSRLLLAGRLALHPIRSGTGGPSVEVAVAGGISHDSAAPIGNLVAAFAGRRRLVGADLRVEWNGWLLAAEGIAVRLDFDGGPTRNPRGWYLTGGRMLSGSMQVLTRWERLDTDGLGDSENLILLGGQFRPSDAVRFRIHYGLPLSSDPLGRHRLVGGVQVAL